VSHAASDSARERETLTSIRDPKVIVNEAALTILPVAKDLIHASQLDDLASSLRRLNLGVFRLVVMGEVKKGKSSFINSLLSEDGLLPTSSDVTTSTVFKLIYGPERRHKVLFLQDPETGIAEPMKEVSRDGLVQYGTEDGNPGNLKRVDFIGVELPHPLLEAGLVIVDTPGVGGLYESHRDITWRFAPNADAIIFVLDSVEAVISADEIKFLKDLTTKFTKRIFFVQTKIDDASESLWRGWEARNKQVLRDAVGIDEPKLFYLPLSAKLKSIADKTRNLKMLDRSGYVPLINFLNQNLIPAKELEIARAVARKARAIASKVQIDTLSQLDAARATTTSELSKIEADRRKLIVDFNAWEQETLQPALANATSSISKARRRALDQIDEAFNPSGRLLVGFVDQVKALTSDEIIGNAPGIQQDFMEHCGVVVKTVFSDFVGHYLRTCNALVSELEVMPKGHTASLPSIAMNESLLHSLDTLDDVAMTPFDQVRASFLGGSVAASVATTAVAVASVAFPPLAAFTAVAAIAAGLLGGSAALQSAKDKEKSQIIGILRRILERQLSQTRYSILRHFEEKAEECLSSLQAISKSSADQTRSDLNRLLSDAEAARTRTKEQAKELITELESKCRVTKSVLAKLEGLDASQRK
jgi:GTPase SAR1 family protein